MKRTALVLLLLGFVAAAQGPRNPKPGFNLFSKEQDIQLGKEAAAEIEKQVTVINDAELNNFVRRMGERLAATPEAGGYPYTFKVVSDKSINAFALPGGPAYVHTGLLAAADNEAQVAGVLAHEIAHVALRHGTNQASKANLLQIPAMLAGSLAGRSGSLLGSLAQLGIGLGANSVLLKFSRTAESDADLVGARMMAQVGYNPIEMARFFEKLEAEGGNRGLQWFSSHPNPGNRRQAIEEEIRYLPKREYTTGDAATFTRVQRRVAALPAPPPKQAQAGGAAVPVPQIRPSGRMREHRGNAYSLTYPDNWQVVSDQQARGVTIAPQEGVVGSGSATAIGVGAVIGFHSPAQRQSSLRAETEELVRQLAASNPGMKSTGSRQIRVDGQPALQVNLQSQSPYSGETEIDTLVTVSRPEGLFYMILIAPRSLIGNFNSSFQSMIRSVRFSGSQRSQFRRNR